MISGVHGHGLLSYSKVWFGVLYGGDPTLGNSEQWEFVVQKLPNREFRYLR